jgi:hypothetical protein
MTARKTRKGLTAEADKFDGGAFQPPEARSGMMKVAGASDEDHKGEQLITDDDQTTMKGPVYDKAPRAELGESRIRMTLGELREMVRRLAQGV